MAKYCTLRFASKCLIYRLLILLIIGLYPFYGQSQTGPELPDFTPSSPEAAQMGRFGQVPLNSATGHMNYSIPIHTIQVGDYQWPVSLNYHYNGLLLEGKPSLFGLGWNLSGMGSINREVRGLPDEKPYGYYGEFSQRSLVETFEATQDPGFLTFHQFEKFRKGEYDGEPDKYTVNLPGITFSFKLDANQQPVYLSKHDHLVTSIEIDSSYGDHHIVEFEVLDDKGIKYVFGDFEVSGIGYQEPETYHQRKIHSSWMLSQITFPNKQFINFQYDDDLEYISYDFVARGAALFADIANPDINEGYQLVTPGYSDDTRDNVMDRKILSDISFPGGTLTFNHNASLGRELFHSIVLKDAHNSEVKDFDFNYQGVRDALTEITFNGEHFYEFQYYGVNDGNISAPNMPSFLSSTNDKARNKDKWQYFNGASNAYAISIPNSDFTADVNPSYAHTKLGCLTRIVYPTKGYTKVDYGQNQVRTANINQSNYYENEPLGPWATYRLDGTYTQMGSERVKDEVIYLDFEYPTVAEIEHTLQINFANATGHLQMSITKIDGCPIDDYYPEDFQFPSATSNYDTYTSLLRSAISAHNYGDPNSNLNPNTPFLCPELFVEMGPDDYYASQGNTQILQGTSGGRVVFLPGTYEIRFYSQALNTTEGFAEIKIKTQAQQGTPPSYANIDVGGLRVEKLIHYADNSTIANREFLHYSDGDGLSTGIQNLIPYNRIISSITTTLNDGVTIYNTQIYDYYHEHYTASNPAIGTPVYYSMVRKSADAGMVNGYTETNYGITGIYGSSQYPKLPQGQTLDDGRVLFQEVRKKPTGYFSKFIGQPGQSPGTFEPGDLVQGNYQIYQQKRSTMDISGKDANPDHPVGFKISPKLDRDVFFNLYDYDATPSEEATDEINAIKALHNFSTYKELDSWFQVKEIRTVEVRNGESVETLTVHKYVDQDAAPDPNEDFLKLRETEVTNLSKGESLITKYYYPENLPSQAYMSDLVLRNQVTTPIRTETYRETDAGLDLLTVNRSTYQSFNGPLGQTLILPDSLFVQKANEPEELRILFEDYSNTGRLLQYRKAGGPVNSVLWGYNSNYPIAKIQNATYAEATAAIGSSIFSESLTSSQESDLRSGLANAMISTYSYAPLIGVQSMTDPREDVTSYTYDNLNRLLTIKDNGGKMLKEYAYGYRSDAYVNPDNTGQYIPLSGELAGPATADIETSHDFTADITGGSGDVSVSWTLNSNFLANNPGSINIYFPGGGVYNLSASVTDNITEENIIITKNITVGYDLGVVSLSANPTFEHIGENINFTSSGMNLDEGTFTYEWYVDNVLQSYQGVTDFETSFNNVGSKTVKLVITETETMAQIEGEVSVTIFDQLSVPTLQASEQNITSGESITFTPGNVSGGAIKDYEWEINSSLQAFDQNAPLTHTFNTTGQNIPVTFRVNDLTFNESEEATVLVNIYGALGVGSLSASSSDIVLNSSVTFTAPTVSGGSGNFSYSWRVNGTQQSSSSGNFTYSQFPTPGTYTIVYRVTDNTLNITDESQVQIQAYSPLTQPSVNDPGSHLTAGDSKNFTTANVGGGSGSRNYTWYVKKDSGSFVEQAYTGQSNFSYTFSTSGTYTIKYRVTDNTISGHFKEATRVVNVYAPLDLSNNDISTPSPVTVNTNTYFNINTVSGGSGDYEYRWSVISGNSGGAVDNLNPRTEANRNVSSYNMGYDFVSNNTTIQCRVVDNLTGDYITVSKSIVVNGDTPVSIPAILSQDTDSAPDSAALRLTALASGGSGTFTYKWYVDGVQVQNGSSATYEYVILNCNTTASPTADVTCQVTDTATAKTAVKAQTFTLDYECNPGGSQ